MAHSHHHHHHHDDSGVGQRNKDHFNEMDVESFTQSAVFKQVAAQITHELQQSFSWMDTTPNTPETPIRMLDYACGNGVISRALAVHFPVIRGIDISSNMVQAYNAEASKAGFACAQMHALEGDILGPEPLPNAEFDLVVMSLALHHIQDPAELILRLSKVLRSGGVLVILDWVDRTESGCGAHSAKFKHIVTRHGFTESEMQAMYAAAGLEGWKWRLFDELCELPADMSGPQQAFMARGKKQ